MIMWFMIIWVKGFMIMRFMIIWVKGFTIVWFMVRVIGIRV
jgi:hypothetical protein